MNIDSFNQVLTETSKSLLGYRKNRKEEWIKTDTWKTIDERKETKKKINDTKSQRIKNQLQTRYSTLDKEVKRKTKADKRAFIENLADEAETAAQMQNMATLYKITKALAGGFKNWDIPMKDADGVVNSAHLLAKHDNKCGAPRPNWDAAHLVRSKEKKMEVDWPRKQNATDIYSKNSHALDPRRKQEEGTTKRDVEKVRGARDEGSRVELGPGRKAGSGQTTMAFLGVGLMCEHARRGLSK